MKRPIGFDVESIQKVTKGLSPQKQKESDSKSRLTDIDDHVLRLSGEVLALGGILRHLINTQSVAQQEMILKSLLYAMEQVKALKLSPTAQKVQEQSLETGKSFTDLMKIRLKEQP